MQGNHVISGIRAHWPGHTVKDPKFVLRMVLASQLRGQKLGERQGKLTTRSLIVDFQD